jgi:hypothetical protein
MAMPAISFNRGYEIGRVVSSLLGQGGLGEAILLELESLEEEALVRGSRF